MLAIILLLSILIVNAQLNYFQQQYPLNNFNSWFTNRPNSPTWNINRAVVRGSLLNDDSSVLPFGSRITVSIVDASIQDVSARPINTFVLYGSYRFPIFYEIPYSLSQIQSIGNNIQQYALQARIEKDGQLLYINDQYTPVRLIPVPNNPINIAMKNVYSGSNGGILTTRPPIVSGIYVCQLRPDTGSCYASIQQYYFDTQSRSCQMFIWGGCGGNQNRFSSREECERTCGTFRRRIMNYNAKQASIL